MIFNIHTALEHLPALLNAAQTTLYIALLACLIGFILGTILGILQTRSSWWASMPAQAYVTIIRGTPMMIQIVFMFYLLPALGIHLCALYKAIIAIGLNSAAYISQVIKTGIASVGKGQLEAAQVLGFTRLQALWYIVLPQAIRLVLPALGNELVTLIKDSSLASTIGVVELYRESRQIINLTYDAISILVPVALIYLLLTSIATLGIYFLEQRVNNARN
ncbi:amino acid ABC transporter permease [Candidatus Dependentiae bacterium]|nr:amino acid ABC transporter permease [Candidatus Dependentiae bacterium]